MEKEGDRMVISVEDASVRELDRLYEIEKECFDAEMFTRQQLLQFLSNYNSIGLVAKENGEIVGFIIGTLRVERNLASGHVLTIDVLPSSRRRGIGRKLLEELERVFKGKGVRFCYLEVREGNSVAISLYEKAGYQRLGRLERYYGDVHGLRFRKMLS